MPRVKKGAHTTTKELASVSPRDTVSKTDPAGSHPPTQNALILRTRKYESQETDENMSMDWMSGREKLDLLVENMGENSQIPFSLKKCLEMAKSQTDAFVNDISNLKDPHKFHSLIKQELQARTGPSRTDLRINPSDHVAALVATRIHNSYMLASAWKIVSEILNEFTVEGLTDQNAKLQLQSNSDLRARYLVLCNMVDGLVKMNQDRSAVLATTTPRYAKYFKLKPRKSSNLTELEYIFDWTYLRDAAEFFMDSIIIELCFPQGKYPQAVLYRILRDAVNEFPQTRGTKRLPPALWNAVGDLFISLELQELLAAPLFGLPVEEEPWKSQPRQMPEEYESWVDAQIFSLQASNLFTNFKYMIDPLYKTKSKSNLVNMWKQIDQNYITISGLGLNALWQLEDSANRKPQGSSIPKIDEESDYEIPAGRAPIKKQNESAKPLALTNGVDDDSDDSMIQLVSVSDTSDYDDDDTDSYEDESDDDEKFDDDLGYDTEEENKIRNLLREAMDAAYETNWLESEPNMPKENDPLNKENIEGNYFLKLLGSLRGRTFTASPKLKTATRTEPRTMATRAASRATPTGVPKVVPVKTPPKPASKSSVTTNSATRTKPSVSQASQKATVEEVEDEDNVRTTSSSKKKKKNSKKKKKK